MTEKISVFSGHIIAFDLKRSVGAVEWTEWYDDSGKIRRREFLSTSVDSGTELRYPKVGEEAEVVVHADTSSLLRVRVGDGIRK